MPTASRSRARVPCATGLTRSAPAASTRSTSSWSAMVGVSLRAQLRLERLVEVLLGVAPAVAAVLELLLERLHLLGLRDEAVDLEHGRALRLLRRLEGLAAGHDLHHRLLELLGGREERDRVALALAHLLAVEPRHERALGDARLRHHERALAEEVVDPLRRVARQLEVLELVLAHGHDVRVVEHDVRGHEHGVVEDARVRRLALVERRLVGVAPLELPGGEHAGEGPGQLEDLGSVALAVHVDALGIEPAGQPGRRDVVGVLAHLRRVAHRRQRVVVGDEEEALVLLGELQRGTDGAEVVPHVHHAGRLHTSQRPLHLPLIART